MGSIAKYLELRDEVDKLIDDLWDKHHENMACKKGCDKCCLNFDVFPVEFDAIKMQVEEEYPDVPDRSMPGEIGDNCVFLQNHICSIYNARPVICRTHGFPLMNMNHEGEYWELSHCELNFTNVDEFYFDEENTYPQDKYNSRLFMLNKEYIEENYPGRSEMDLVPLANLLKSNDD